MADKTAIEWTDATWTPVRARRWVMLSDGSGKERIGWHCEHASPGCKECYAEGINKRLGTGQEFKPAHLKHTTRLGDSRGDVTVFLDEKMLLVPLKWKRPREIFVCSMTDIAAAFVPDSMLLKMFAVMALTPWHTYQVLTKRSARLRQFCNDPEVRNKVVGVAWEMLGRLPTFKHDILATRWPLPNVWIGASIEDQPRAHERLPDLIATQAAIRFISYEPALEAIDLTGYCNPWGPEGASAAMLSNIHWLISGGESGNRARPSNPEWYRSVRDQCAARGIPYLHKQNGSWAPGSALPEDITSSTYCDFDGELKTDDERVWKVGKKTAGRLLDGVEHNGMPS